MKTFATEEDKSKAIDEFDERTGDTNGLDEIMNAEIKPPEEGVVAPPTSEELPPEPKPDDSLTTPVEDQLAPGKEPEVSEMDILKEELANSKKYIQENFSNQANLKALEDKVSKLESTYSENAPPSQKQEVEMRQSKLTELQTRRKSLLSKYPNPEDQLTQEYVDEMNGIQDGLFEEMGNSQHNLSIVQGQVKQATEKADSYVDAREKESLVKSQKKEQLNEAKAIEGFSEKTPQFKLSKPFDEVNQDYIRYQNKVSTIYLGREPQNRAEIDEAMTQLKRRSPHLTTKLKMAGVETKPTQDMTKYLGLCELWDSWTGLRKDPLTGDYNRDKNGKPIPLMRYEPSLKKYVPDRYPSVEAAYNDKSAKEGYYVKQLVNAKIEGGKQVIGAISQRDKGATELGVTETSGGQLQTVEEAFKRINEIDEVEAMRMAYSGDTALLKEYNELAKTVGWAQAENPMAI